MPSLRQLFGRETKPFLETFVNDKSRFLSVKQFKKLTLTFSGLLVVAFSFSFTGSSDIRASYRSNAVEFHLTAIAADDTDDDFGDPGFEKVCHRVFQNNCSTDSSSIENHSLAFDPHHTSVPFYLQVRNLRI